MEVIRRHTGSEVVGKEVFLDNMYVGRLKAKAGLGNTRRSTRFSEAVLSIDYNSLIP